MPTPRVTVLLPARNEAPSIDSCLESLSTQDYAGEIEIVVADGQSEDDTVARVEEWRGRLPRLVVIDNPDRVQSVGLNRAAQAATGEILIRADAHTTYAADYVRRSVEALEETQATAVGGTQTPAGTDGFARAVAEAMRTPLAVGPAPFRHASERREVDTVYLGAFRKADFERLGGYRTLPSRVAEDADLYFRWRLKGAKIVVDPTIRSRYTPRSSPAALWRQFYRYGLGKADMLYVNGRWPSWRPAAPLALVLGLLAGVIAGVVWSWWPLVVLLGLWLGVLLVAARARPLVAAAGAIMHLAYGLGLLRGLFRSPASLRGETATGNG